jgi:hypothetical protein
VAGTALSQPTAVLKGRQRHIAESRTIKQKGSASRKRHFRLLA